MEQKIFGVIYKITNVINGKVYIGQTICFERRWKEHITDSRRKNPKSVIGKAIKKYGGGNFNTKIVYNAHDQDELNDMEIHVIAEHKSTNREVGYNRDKGGVGSSGHVYVCSDKTKAKLSEINKGKTLSKETKQKIGDALKCKQKPPFSDEHKEKLSDAKRGNPLSDEHRAKISAAKKGKKKGPHSNESRQKMSDSSKKCPVIQLSKSGEFITEYVSLCAAECATGVFATNISNVCKGKKKSAGGFLWAYSDTPIIR